MTEVVQQTKHTSPLDEIHRGHGATMTERDGWVLPASYGDTMAEYSAVRDGGCGLIDLSSRGCIVVTGSETVQFLNGLITNDVKTLEKNSWMPAAFANVQGRLLAAARVIHQDDAFVIDTETVTHNIILKLLERFTLAGDFKVDDLTSETAMLSVQGEDAGEIIRAVLGDVTVQRRRVVEAQLLKGGQVTVIRATHTAEDGFDLFVSSGEAASLWESLTAAGARPVGHEALEVLRVEAGIPRYGVDMNETTVVTETNLDDAVSFTKGCYIGQEIIVRIKHRGHVAKKMTGLALERDEPLESGAKVFSTEGKEIGRITSSVVSPCLGRPIALGYVRYDYLAPGTEVKVISAEERFPAAVSALPFVRGSWYSG